MSYRSNQSSTHSNKDAVLVLCEMVRQHLGINGSMRCVVAGDEQDDVYVKDTVEILKCLDIQHPAGVYVIKICQGHKDVYGCGVKSLLFFIGQLCSQVQILMKQGVPLVYIEELLNEAIDCCVENLQPVTVPVTISSISDTHHVQPQGLSKLLTLPQPASSNSSDHKDHLGSRSEHRHSCPQNVRCMRGFSNFKTNVKKIVSGTSHADEFDIGETVGPVRADERTCNFGLNKEGTVHENLLSSTTVSELHLSRGLKSNLSQLSSPQKSHTVVNSRNTSSSVILPALNDFFHHHRKPTSLTKRHKTVILSSRHLKDCGSLEEDMNCCDSELGNTRDLLVDTKKHLDHLPHIQDLSFDTCVLTKHKPLINEAAGKTVFLPEEAQSLCHGSHEMMSWAEEAMRHHLLQGRHSQFDTGLIHTVCISGRHGAHQLLDGLVVSASFDIMETVSKISHPASVLLVIGDLTAEFKHKGHRAALSAVRVTDSVESLHQHPQSWSTQVLDLLKQLDISVVLVRGMVNADLHIACMATGIALVDHVPFRALKVLQSACQVDLITYILDAHEGSVCCGVSLKPLQEDWCDTFCTNRKHLMVTPPVFVQTMVISEPSAAGKGVKEEEFWHCAARLRQAAEDGKLLQGGGLVEEFCARHLTAHLNHPGKASVGMRWPGELSLYRPVVRAALVDVFHTFTRTVHRNRQTAGCSTHSQQNVCDGPNPHRCDHVSSCSVGQNTGHYSHCSLFNKLPNSHCCESLSSSSVCQSTARDPNHPLLDLPMLEACPNHAESPSHEPLDLQMLKTDQEFSSAKLPLHICETQNACKNSHLLPVLSCHACTGQNSTETDSSSSQPFLQDMGRDPPDLGDPGRALDNQQWCGQCSDRQKVSAAEDGWRRESVWDNYISKTNGWRSAVQCVCTLMRMDEMIVTGVDQQTQPVHTVLL